MTIVAGAGLRFTGQTACIGDVGHKPSSSGCHYFLPGPRLPSQFQTVTALGRCQFLLLDERKHVFVNDSDFPVGRCVTARRGGIKL